MAVVATLLIWLATLLPALGKHLTELPAYSIDSTTNQFIDEYHRQRYFHGLNVVVKGPPWYPDMKVFNVTTSFTKKDAELLSHLGMNVIRLGVMWPGVEPTRGQYDDGYLSHVVELIHMAADYGIHVLADMHQDVLSDRFCGEGIPVWATDTAPSKRAFPAPLAASYPVDATGIPKDSDCSKINWAVYYMTYAVGEAFQSLYDGPLHHLWAKFWVKVAETLGPLGAAVLGYELINEPFAGDALGHPTLLIPCRADSVNLQPAFDKLAAQIRTVDDSHCIFFDTVTWDDFCVGFDHVPGGDAWRNKSVLSYHYYEPPQFRIPFAFGVIQKATQRLGSGSMLTEFDVGQGMNPTTMQNVMDECDNRLQSWIGWEYKPFLHAKTGYADCLWNANGTVNRRMAGMLSRTYPWVVAGVATHIHFDAKTAEFELDFIISPNVTLNETIVYLNEEYHYPAGYVVTCAPPSSVTWAKEKPNFVVVRHRGLQAGATVTVHITPKAAKVIAVQE